MTKETERELLKLVDRIRNYPKGFEFTVNYASIPTKPKLNGMRWVLKEAENQGLIESISMGMSFEDLRGESGLFCSEETFVRL